LANACFVALDQRDEYIELVTLLAALRGTPASVDFLERRAGDPGRYGSVECPVLIRQKLRHRQGVDIVVLGVRADEISRRLLSTKIEGSHKTIFPAADFRTSRASR